MLKRLKIAEKDYTRDKYRVWNSYCGLTNVTNLETGKEGYLDSNAHEVIPCIYETATDFSEGYAIVIDTEPKVINTKGEIISVLPKSWLYNPGGAFHNGLFLVEKPRHEGYNYINIKGETLLSKCVDEASEFSDGLAVITSHYTSYIIDTKGKVRSDLLEGYRKLINNGLYVKLGFNFQNGLLPVYDDYAVIGYIYKDGRYFKRTDALDSVYNFTMPQYLIERPLDKNSESLKIFCSDITYFDRTITLVADTKEELALKKKEFYKELKNNISDLVKIEIDSQLEEKQGITR